MERGPDGLTIPFQITTLGFPALLMRLSGVPGDLPIRRSSWKHLNYCIPTWKWTPCYLVRVPGPGTASWVGRQSCDRPVVPAGCCRRTRGVRLPRSVAAARRTPLGCRPHTTDFGTNRNTAHLTHHGAYKFGVHNSVRFWLQVLIRQMSTPPTICRQTACLVGPIPRFSL